MKSTIGTGIVALAIAATLTGVAIAQRGPSGHVGVHVVELPKEATKTKKKDVKILLETPRLKIAAISLRSGTVLAAHSAPTPITIQAVSGRGILRAKGKDFALTSGTLLALAPNQEHSVVPDGKGDIVVVVHYLKSPMRRGRNKK